MPSYVLPQVLVFQEFEAQPVALDLPLRACIVGPQYDLHRYSDAGEKAAISVGEYDPLNEQCYSWPGRAAGGVVDFDYTRVFIDDALLQYYHDASGDSSIITHVAPGKNRIRATSRIWQTANGFTRTAALLRDVQVGDVVKLVASACGVPVVFNSYVAGLIADTIAAIIDDASSDVSNQASTTADTSSSQTVGPFNAVDISSVDGSTFDGLADGYPEETYTIEVVGASVSGNATSAILKVTSASGTDDQPLVTPSAFGSPTDIGTRGLTVTFENAGASSSTPDVDPDDFLIGQKFVVMVSQLFTRPVPTSGGTYVGETDTTYIVEVSLGGTFAGATAPQISVSTTTGVDISGPTDVAAAATDVAVGTQGVLIQFAGLALNKGDRYTIPATAAAPGAVRTLVLANNLPDAMRGECAASSSSSSSSGAAPDLDLTLYIKKNIEVTENRVGFAPIVNWTQSATELCMSTGVVGYDADWAIAGVMQALDVMGGTLYVQHRDSVAANCGAVGTLDTVSAVADALGVVHPDNPLAFGVFKALENANGVEVKYLAVCPDVGAIELADWLAALEILVGRDDVYSIVPLTQDKDVLDAVLAHCESESSPESGRWRICWLNKAATQVKPIYVADGDGAPLLGTITDDPDTAGTQYTLLESTDAEFTTKGVRAGDTVRAIYVSDGFGNYTYSEFTVDAVINEESLRLASGPDVPVNTPSKFEIHRTLTKTELATEQATYPGLFSSRRAALVWPDLVGNAGLTFAGYFLCAGLAGLRSGVLPHQGLTNVEVLGFDDITRTTEFFSASQLNVMAASGYWIVTQDPNDGSIFTRHQLTTGDQSDINQREQSVTTNLDQQSYTYLNRLKVYIGRGNVTDTMINIIRGEVISIIQEYKNTVVSDRLGPQLIDAVITELGAHPTFRDRMVARITNTLPAPFNNLDLHLVVA